MSAGALCSIIPSHTEPASPADSAQNDAELLRCFGPYSFTHNGNRLHASSPVDEQ